MTILLTGGTGNTSSNIASLLSSNSIPYILTSRKPSSSSSENPTVKFTWEDHTTWSNPFTSAKEPITAIFLTAGSLSSPAEHLNPFIDFALEKHGVKRFVLVAGSSAEYGGAYHGLVWKHMVDKGCEWCVLRPSWFMENFSAPGQGNYETILYQSSIFSACADGKIPFISAEDIAAVAFKALTDDKSHNTAYRILGPELLTYDQIAEKLSKALNKKIQHVKLTEEQRKKSFLDAGLPEHMAGFLTHLEVLASKGGEELVGDDVEKVTGRKPVSFEKFVEKNREGWTG